MRHPLIPPPRLPGWSLPVYLFSSRFVSSFTLFSSIGPQRRRGLWALGGFGVGSASAMVSVPGRDIPDGGRRGPQGCGSE